MARPEPIFSAELNVIAGDNFSPRITAFKPVIDTQLPKLYHLTQRAATGINIALARLSPPVPPARPEDQKFFGSFFQKRTSYFT
jgi:hypothetical protein